MSALDVNEATFEKDVIEESRRRPVVVDFWAPWCGPCRVLGPTLEKLAEDAGGAWRLAKIDTDQNQALAARYRIQGIPAVKAFRDGAVVAEFVGALPEGSVKRWLEGFLPGKADALAEAAERLREEGKLDEAESTYREALAERSLDYRSLVGLARIALSRKDKAAAADWLSRVQPEDADRHGDEMSRLKLDLRETGGLDEEALRDEIATDPRNAGAHLRLGHALAARESWAQALEAYLEVVRIDTAEDRDEARRAMLEIFEIIGRRSELAEDYRSALAKELFK